MPLGMGPAGWFYLWNPWLIHALWYRPPVPYWAPWGPMSKEEEIRILEEQARLLEAQLAEIKERLKELQK